MAGRRSKISKEDVVAAIAAVRAQQKLVMQLPGGSLVGAALVKAELGRGEYGTVQRLVAEVLAEEAVVPAEQVGEIVVDTMSERLKPVMDGLARLLQQVQAEALRSADDRVKMIEAGSEARVRASEGLRDQALQQLAVAELAAPQIDELQAAVEKAVRERDRALGRIQVLEAEVAALKEEATAAAQQAMPLDAGPKPTEKQISFARRLAQDRQIQLPDGFETDLRVCKAFLDQHSERAGAAG
jgi:hypothetical protein